MTDMSHVRPALITALTAKGYAALTPVQLAVLDPELENEDLLVSAQTGSGKTVAFGIALAPTLLAHNEFLAPTETPLAVCIAPTRELALQVTRELEWLYRSAGAKMATCVGGMDMRDERRALGRGAHIVVGTPGRLCDHIKRGSLDMSGLRAIVLDEADEMLKMGFREELELILGAAPDERRTLMFSATVPKSILGMTQKYQKNAIRVNTAAEARQHVDIAYRALVVDKADKENAIINVLRYYDAKNAIVFGDTRVAVNRMVSRFNNRGFSVVALSGELSQAERTNALQALRDGRAQVCIATDVAARGLDLPDLELVIHADVPKNPEALLHRSGRTGRAGRKGVSALIVPHQSRRRVDRLLNDAKVKAEWAAPPSAEEVIERDNQRLLESDMLNAPVDADDMDMVSRILNTYSAEQIAAAFVRQYRDGRSAPEELTDAGDAYEPSNDSSPRRERKPRNDFEGGTWFSLNLGRKQRAEPRWILPMLCKSGDLKKAEIGAIKISETATFVEISPSGLERFKKAIGPEGKIEKAITARQIDGQPDMGSGAKQDGRAPDRPARKPRKHESDAGSYAKKPYGKSSKKPSGKPSGKAPGKPAGKAKSGSETSYTGKRENEPEMFTRKPRNEENRKPRTSPGNDGNTSGGDMPPKRKKPHKKKIARAAERAAKAGKGGKRK